MEACNTMGRMYPLELFVMLILVAYCQASAVHVESNTSSPYNGGLGAMEFLVNPFEGRQLYNLGNGGRDPNNAPFACGGKKPEPYCVQGCNKRNDYDRCTNH